MSNVNDHLVLICGTSGSGKSASLRALTPQTGVMYLNCESGKKLPFAHKFKEGVVTDPYQVLAAFDQAETMPDIHTIVIDSITFLLDMYESVYIVGSSNGQQAWQNFQQFFKTLMQDKVAKSSKNVIFTAHTLTTLNENEAIFETKVPVKGALKNNGIEAYFSCVVATKKMPIKKLEAYKNDLLNITPEEEALGFKYVFQTKLTKDTTHERIRGPMGLFTTEQTYIDNDAQKLLKHLSAYYS